MKLLPLGSLALPLLFGVCASAQVTTSQYDNSRTGATLTEKILTPPLVNSSQFGKVGVFKVDGAVFAQPLILAGVEIPGKGAHDVLFIATEHDSVYAFDANNPNAPPLWQVSLLDRKLGTSPVSARDTNCPFIQPEVGITSTPVLDTKTGTLYVLSRSMAGHYLASDQYFQHLHALAITTGVEKFGGPKLIAASVPGKGAGSKDGQVAFDPLRENPRAALVLTNNTLYLTWGSSCDVDPYHGWVMAYDPQTLAQKAVLNITPDGSEGGIWASDTGPAADAEGNVYVPTANGTFDPSTGGRNFGDSVLKLALKNSSLEIRDSFTPHNQEQLSTEDADLGSSGPLLLPDQPGPHRHLLVQPTKGARIYVLDRDHLGGYRKELDDIVQVLRMEGGGFGAMSYWNGHIFFAASDDYLRDYVVTLGQLVLSKTSVPRFRGPVATVTVSASGNQNAVVWAVATKTWNGDDRPAILYAFDATNISNPLYTSEQNSARDRAAPSTRFCIPIVFNGHVYFGARGEVEMYGLLK